MCGIFGIVNNAALPTNKTLTLLRSLFSYSESRGKEASGLCMRTAEKLSYMRSSMSAHEFLKSDKFAAMNKAFLAADNLAAIGHTRLVTNGAAQIDLNNQPVCHSGTILVHNGIICNHLDIWKKLNSKPSADLDSEVIAAYTNQQIEAGKTPSQALKMFFEVCEGTASVAMLFAQYNVLVVGSNNSSLYICHGSNNSFVFASEGTILKKSIAAAGLSDVFDPAKIRRLDTKEVLELQLHQPQIVEIHKSEQECKSGDELKRCTKCILPETFPGIQFDAKGVCSVCQTYEPIKLKGYDKLKAECDKHRRTDGKPDCIVAFSGGRDSSYAVHYMKNVMGMNPITYTYDWGMVTDLARRNIARVCGKLGLENVLVSADIKKKRGYIKSNLEAWLAKPELGMVTLLMAGDKEYFYHVKRLQKEFGIELVIYASSQLERSNFKSAFCGVEESNKWFFNVSKMQKFKMLKYFATQYLRNPRYINSSIFDTLFAFYCAYVQKHTFISIFDYIPWDEKELMKVLQDEYNWEAEQHSDVTWRIGDGTAALYNYIYYSMAGFTENDTFRSNQIRNGIITREKALNLAKNDNKPRFESIKTYAALIGVDFDKIIQSLANYKKFY
jgi:hypothetical protein